LALFLLLAIAIASLAASLRPPAPLRPPPPGGSFDDVTLVEPGGGRRQRRRLGIEGGRIGSIGPARTTADDPYAGAFVLPGLTDMHVHLPAFRLPGELELTAFLLLAHGITTVRVAADGRQGLSPSLRDAVAAGEIAGPRIFSCGPFVDGDPPLWPNSRVVEDAPGARAVVDALADAGVDCVKAYDNLTAEATDALREAAHARGLPLIGHTPRRVAFERARLDDVQHLRGVHPPFRDERMQYPFFLAAWHRTDAAWLDRVTAVSLESNLAHTPTLATIDALLRARDWPRLARSPAFDLVPAPYRDALWHGETGLNAARFMTPEDFEMVGEAFEQMKRTVLHLHRAGVKIHTGTDANAPMLVPGASLHRELALLVEAGLSPEEALALSTRSSPAFLGVDGLGELRAGAPAELAIYREDPTRDLAALDTLLAVVRGGRILPRELLEQQLALYREHFHGVVYRRIMTPLAHVAVDVLIARRVGTSDADAAAP
jgi:imidazolonepropionase-like amidohydrolase